MTTARQELLDFIARTGWDGAAMVEVALQEAADNRAHAEAEKLRARARDLSASATGLVADAMSGATMAAATSIDPYAMRDGQLVRKADGKPVIL